MLIPFQPPPAAGTRPPANASPERARRLTGLGERRLVAPKPHRAAACKAFGRIGMSGWNYADVWEAIAAAVPHRRALIQGERVISWGQFDQRADAIARRML